MATLSNKPWGSISEADYQDADAYCSACLVDMNDGSGPKTKSKCFLPIREPGGATNRNGVASAAAYLARTQIPAAEKAKAAKRLISIYRNDLNEDPPPSLKKYT